MTPRQVVVSALILGVVAGLVVWYLERFEKVRLQGEFGNLTGEIHEYLANQDAFSEWLKTRKV